MPNTEWMEFMSATRAKRIETCPRQEWWHSTGAVPPWRPAHPLAHEAYALRSATSLEAALGSAIHAVAADIAKALRDGRRPISVDDAVERVRSELAILWRAKDAATFRRNPKRNGFLLARLQGREISNESLAGLKVRIPTLVQRLLDHPIWEHVRQCCHGDIVVIDALDSMLTNVDGQPVKVFSAPDLVYISRESIELPGYGIPVPAGTPVIVDWKTGRVGDAHLQLALYAYYVREHLRIPPGPLGYLGRVGDLQSEDLDEIGGQAALIAEPEMRMAWARMESHIRQLHDFTDANGRLDRERMPKDISGCRFCPFVTVCEGAASAAA